MGLLAGLLLLELLLLLRLLLSLLLLEHAEPRGNHVVVLWGPICHYPREGAWGAEGAWEAAQGRGREWVWPSLATTSSMAERRADRGGRLEEETMVGAKEQVKVGLWLTSMFVGVSFSSFSL